ncbi:GNAT family N-acetyltransferase [Candidatus Dojkabacteria bacterium]|uniref:GNAT family N-acetyltransferase n=1 Tax=Candidatus Dojkabacteria bacterium TaxID=2099670 RepID=A0A5C7J5N9_9BACT|nr:MAG: GNAT family N-acetyltransferase [Candidatus Dojkabacteria bacterium]
MIYADHSLSQKLERTEARANAAVVESRARHSHEIAAEWIKIAGTYALFDGCVSPLTQTFCLGMFDEITETELSSIESFFRKHGAAVNHEVSPLADISLMSMLNNRGYRPIELSNVMFMSIDDQTRAYAKISSISTRIINSGEEKLWAQTSAQGWLTEGVNLSDFMLDFGIISARSQGGFAFIAEIDAKPIATGMLFIFDDVALLGGASTAPEQRGLGAQSALLQARLSFAQSRGCNIAMMCAAPGSQSQRNAEKNGFGVAYTRTKWHREI